MQQIESETIFSTTPTRVLCHSERSEESRSILCLRLARDPSYRQDDRDAEGVTKTEFDMKNKELPPNTVNHDSPPEVPGISIDASLILESMRSEIEAMELARKLQSEQPINDSTPAEESAEHTESTTVTLTEALLHGFDYLYKGVETTATQTNEGEPVGYPKALPEDFYHRLPKMLQGLPMEHKEYPHLRDAVLMGQLTVLSAVTPYCTVWEDKKQRSCTLYLFVVGNPSAGKSAITATKDVLQGIDKMLREEKEQKMKEYARRKQAYDIVMKELEKNSRKLSMDDLATELAKVEEPKEPFTPQIMMPQRTTEARFIQDLVKNQGHPQLMLLSEVQTLFNANGREHGNYLDELLEIYDNTAIDKRLKTNNEELYVEHPALAVLLTGVPNQLPKLFKGFDSGLESRFNSMVLHINTEYRAEDDEITREHQQMVAEMQQVLCELYDMLAANGSDEEPYQLCLTAEMKQQMDSFLHAKGGLVEAMHRHPNAVSVVRRRRLDFKRLLLVITLFRQHDGCGDWTEVLSTKEIVPTMEDVDLVLYLVNYLIDHTLYVLSVYAGNSEEKVEFNLVKTKQEVFHTLPRQFLANEAKDLLKAIGDTNADRTVKNWERANLIAYTGKQGKVYIYRKLTTKETQQQQKLSLKQLVDIKRHR